MRSPRIKFYLQISVLLVLAALLGACGAKRGPGRQPPSRPAETLADIRDFPQNLEVYARLAGPNRRLLTPEEQDFMDRRFNSILFGAWHMGRSTIARKDVAAPLRRARGYRHGSMLWTQTEWDEIAANAACSSFPSRAQPAITLRDTDLREIPTSQPRFSEPVPDVRANPFDYFQYSRLPIGTPLFVAHTSLDGQWHYVECAVAGGWVQARDVAYVDEAFRRAWESGPYAAIARDGVELLAATARESAVKAGVGAVLPLQGPGLTVLVPRPGAGGFAAWTQKRLGAADAVKKPMPLTPANVARIGNVMMGQPYGWGGMLGNRDCSAMTREIFTPFGLWLPRNSRAQARQGAVLPLSGLSAADKERLILQNGVPFLSLVGMRGHITLYVGAYKGRPAIFHNVWGVRTVEPGNDDARHVIGRAVVTSISPGSELSNLYRPVTFVDRLASLSTPGR